MKKLLTFLTLLTLSIGVGWAETVTFDATTDKGSVTANGTTVNGDTYTKDGITITSSNGVLGNGSDYRVYQNGTLTIASTVGKITKIEITCTGSGTANYGPGKLSFSSGTGNYTYNDKIGTWTGSLYKIDFSASAQVRMTQIIVTYDSEGGSGEEENSTLLYESFNKYTTQGGRDDDFNHGSGTFSNTSNDLTWSNYSTVYGANHCIRMGSGSGNGSITSPAVGQATTEAELSFDLAGWNSGSNTLTVTINGGGTFSDGTTSKSFTATNSTWNTFTETLKDLTANTTITFSGKRFFLDEIKLTASEAAAYTITITQPTEGGTINASAASANENEEITLTANPATGYEFTAWDVKDASNNPITVTNNKFIMPASNVTVTATFSAINYNIYRTITAQNSNDQGGWIGDWVNCTLPGGASGNDYVVTSTYGTEVQFKAGNNEGYKILAENVTAKDANNNDVPLTVVSSDNSGIVFKFNMPANNVTISAYFTFYQPDMYLMGTANDQNWQQTYKMTYSNDQYTIRAYFAGQSASDPYGYFQFEGDGTRYASGASGDYWPISENGAGESHFGDEVPLYANSSKNFRVPAGIYDIVINKDRNKVTVNPVAVNITFSPAAGSVYQGTTVTASSNLYTLLHAINSSITESSVTNEVSLDGTTFSSSVALNNTGSATVTGKATYGYIAPTATANYTVNEAPAGDIYELVTSTNDLNEEDQYIIVAQSHSKAMGIQNSNNRAAAQITLTDNDSKAVINDDTEIFSLEEGEGGWYFKATKLTSGYLHAASSSNNYLKTEDEKEANALAAISINESGLASVVFQGSYSRNVMQYNNGSDLFACYGTASQKPVYIYKKGSGTSKAPVITPESGNIVGFSQEVEITQSNGGNIYYTIDGTTPDENSTPYNGKFWVGGNLGDVVTVIAVAKEAGKELSNTVTVNYKFVAPAAPVFTPGAGTYTTPQTVTVSSTTEGADVYYTATSGLSAAQIVAQGTKFEEPFTVSTPTTYYAVTVYHDAHANRDALSGIRQAQYKFSEVESVDLPYSRPFTDSEGFGDGEFTIQDVENPDDITVWTVSTQYGAKGTSFTSNPNTNHAATSWLLSPYINLGDAEEPVLTFVHQINRHFTNPSTQATVWIKSYGGEWAQLTTGLPENSNGIGSGEWPSFDEEYDLSAYKGQIIQIGFKYHNPTAGSGAGTWEIQNFLVKDNAPIMVENIAEYLALPIGTNNITFKNPVIVQYHYISDSGKSYIYVKDDSGCAYFHQPAVDGETAIAQLDNGDIIAGGFSGNKVPDEMVGEGESNFAMFTDLENFAPNGDKGLADPEHETVAHIADATMGVALNNHYITIKKVKLSALYQPTGITYGGEKYFDIDNVAHIGYNKFNIDYSVVDDVNAYYDITGIFTAYNNTLEFHPTEIVKWEEAVVTLRELCADGVENNEYTISNNLMCVFAKGNSIWVKDDTGQSIWMTSPAESDANFEVYAEAAEGIPANTRLNQAYYDQSNWCEIKLADGVDASQFEGQIIKGGTIHGEFTDKTNPTLENVTLTSAAISSEGDYAPNYYMPANFEGPQKCFNPNHSTDYGQNYFFMTPKPQEYAQIVWAVWDASSTSMIMSTDDNRNGHRFAGEFEIDLSMNDGASSYTDIENGATYNFTAIIKRTNSKAEGYKVYPLDLDGQNPATAINKVETGNGQVKSVKYVNVAGMVSDVPFQGVNIVVTEYTDGTRTTSKMLKR